MVVRRTSLNSKKNKRYLLLLPLLLLGLALIAVPLVTSMPEKADAGERILSELRPFVQAAAACSALVDHTLLSRIPLIQEGQEHLADLEQLASLPDLRLLVWVFIVPGILLVLSAGGMTAIETIGARAGGRSPDGKPHTRSG